MACLVQNPVQGDACGHHGSAGTLEQRYYIATSGTKLPLRLINPIEPDGIANRNTYVRAYCDPDGQLSGFDKIVYGEVELSHRYEYAEGVLRRARITMLDEETVVLDFNAQGEMVTVGDAQAGGA